MKNKITEEELKLIQEQQNSMTELINGIGILESQKHGLLHEVAEVNKKIEDNKKVLEDKYGKVSINLEDGSYKEIEEEETSENA
tara:strand:- start:1589 stop:1840 length:252 start_codon:yes stop_codon:yes gene_type:complete